MLTEVKLLPLPLKFRLIYVLHHLYFHVKCATSDGLIVRILKFQFSSAIVLLIWIHFANFSQAIIIIPKRSVCSA